MSRELVFDRAVALLLAAERHVDRGMGAYVGRDDMPGTRLLLGALHKIVEDAQRRIVAVQRALEKNQGGMSRRDVDRELRDVQMIARHVVRLVGQPLHYVTTPHGREFDPIAIAYSRMAREIQPRTELIFRRSEHRGYALSVPLLEMLTDNLVNAGSNLVDQIKRLPTILYLQYPAHAEGDVLQHLLIAHEAAHLVLRQPVGKRTEAEDRFERAIRETMGGRRPKADHKVRERSLRWFTEIACDVLAVRLAGPAYYVALCEHALVRQWFYRPSDHESATHPHPAWRLARAREQLRHFDEKMNRRCREAVAAAIEPYVEVVPDATDKIAAEPYGKAIEAALDNLIEDLADDRLLGKAALDRELLAMELPLVLDSLERGLAPAELIEWTPDQVRKWKRDPSEPPRRWSHPLDWRSILNGGYLHLVNGSATAPKPLRGAWRKADERRKELVDHLRGAVELSEFHRAAQDVDKLRMLETPHPVAA